MLPKNVRNNGKSRCQKHITHDLTRPWPRPGELMVISQALANDNSKNGKAQMLRIYILIQEAVVFQQKSLSGNHVFNIVIWGFGEMFNPYP